MTIRARAVIAVVDDDRRVLESLENLLESAGYGVELHASGGSLLASDLSTIDCLITDIGLPEMDGFELRDRVKQARPELPIFFISARRDLVDDQPVEKQGNRFFRKPFDGPALLAALDAALCGPSVHGKP